jgi:hypothetical protein
MAHQAKVIKTVNPKEFGLKNVQQTPAPTTTPKPKIVIHPRTSPA